MEPIILFVDDASHAREQLRQPTAGAPAHPMPSGVVHWVLVACAPRMTHRISKWVSHSARENWRAKWFAKTQEQLLPLLAQGGNQVTALLAKGPLAELTDQLQAAGASVAQVVDARRPKTDMPQEPARPDNNKRWSPLPGTLGSLLTGFGALWVLALE